MGGEWAERNKEVLRIACNNGVNRASRKCALTLQYLHNGSNGLPNHSHPLFITTSKESLMMFIKKSKTDQRGGADKIHIRHIITNVAHVVLAKKTY